MADISDLEGRGIPDLFRLQIRVVWLYQPLPRFRFTSPQTAGIRLVRPRTAPEPVGEVHAPALTPLEKFTLLQESHERCYWCAREFGSRWVLRGRLRRLRLEWDHVIPESRDGATNIDNMVPSCNICNGWKSDREFATEAEIRAFLEDQWTKALAPIAARPSPEPEAIVEAAPAAIADEPVSIVPTAPARQRPAHIPKPKPEPARLGKLPSRPLPKGLRVKINALGPQSRYGITDGPSRDRPEWTRVLVGAKLVPWRFDTRDLERVEEQPEAA